MTDVKDITKKLDKLAKAKRLNVDSAREAVDDAEVIRDAAQGYLDREVADAVDTIMEAFEDLDPLADLGILISSTKLAQFRALVDEIILVLPDEDEVRAIVETWDNADDLVGTCAEHKASPREYDTDEKQAARDEAAEALQEFSNILDSVAASDEEDAK